MHKKISGLLSAILTLIPASVWAKSDAIIEMQEKLEDKMDAVRESPVTGMVMYTGGAIVVFVGLIIVVFLLIMVLKR